ncbi:hypothetical protein V5O48_012280 [Marasmius crinis-equi]|uniref:Nephrocystin 3-like N-terminal domain-containing protein n=1 Tax=Marasmius crinis-equi TaxID=585013 RepID=A0ABR3F3C0_9AGAR
MEIPDDSSVNNYNGQFQNINQGNVQNVNAGSGNFFAGDATGNFFQTFNPTNAAGPNAHHTLWEAVVDVGASHRAEQQCSRGSCLEGTREEVLRMIGDWEENKEDLPICWLSGAAGVGKSTIAMTIAKLFEEKGLLSSFFFFRSDPQRNNPSALMLTIAHDLTLSIPMLRDRVNQRVSDDPRILNESMEVQYRELVLKPSRVQGWAGWQTRVRNIAADLSLTTRKPDLVIIDGLDECSDAATQLRILDAITDSYDQSPRPPFRFLICSRSESWIRQAFTTQPLRGITKSIVLDDGLSPAADIERYLIHEFQGIRAKYSQVRFPENWPSKEDIGCLVQRSGGQFVYVKIAVEFVKLRFFHPVNQLRIIIDNTPHHPAPQPPFHKLDCLYNIVLRGNPDHSKDLILAILAAIVVFPLHLDLRPSPEFLELLFGLASGEVALKMQAMYSVLDIRDSKDEIRVYHTSFTDYLFDQTRSGEFYIDEAAHHYSLTRRWLQALSRSNLNIASYRVVARKYLWDWREAFGGMVSWLESSMDFVDPDLINRLREAPKYLHLEVPSDNPRSQLTDPGHTGHKLMIDLAVLGAVWIEYHQPLSVEASAQRVLESLLGFTRTDDEPRSPPFRITGCYCPHPTSTTSHSSSFHFDRRAYHTACLRTAKRVVPEWWDIPVFIDSEVTPITNKPSVKLKRKIKSLLDSTPSQGYPFDPELFPVFKTLFEFLQRQDIGEKYTALEKARIEWLEWLETCPDGYATEAEALKEQITDVYHRRTQSAL